ncbi:MAG: Tim44 domain-containing protein [Thermodesulfovibrionales bacterium]
MNKKTVKAVSLITALLFLSIFVFELDAYARAGGGRSFGSRGSRSFSSPSRPYSNPSPSTPVQPASPQQPGGGGFLRGLGGGLLGGLIGGMLFSSLGFGGLGSGFGGSGIGIFEILLICGIGYLIFRMVKGRRKEENLSYQSAYQQGGQQRESVAAYGSSVQDREDTSAGISHIQQMDPQFDEARFKDSAMDIFFKIQGAWMNRNLSPANSLLTDEMRNIFNEEINTLLKEKKVNRLENIAVRNVQIVEVWQETGQDFITVLLTANLLDYTTDDSTGKVIAGSNTDPVKFEEYWTFTRTVGNNPWKLSAISQG